MPKGIGYFAKAAGRVAKKAMARGKEKRGKVGAAMGKTIKSEWIKNRYGSVLTSAEREQAEKAWKDFMLKERRARKGRKAVGRAAGKAVKSAAMFGSRMTKTEAKAALAKGKKRVRTQSAKF